MHKDTPEDMRPTMEAWFPGVTGEDLDYVCEIAAQISNDPGVAHKDRSDVLVDRITDDAILRQHPRAQSVVNTLFNQ